MVDVIYYIGYTPSPGNWTGQFNRAVVGELRRRGLSVVELPPCDWAGCPPLERIAQVPSRPEDVWLLGWAQSPAADVVASKPGRKFAWVVGLGSMPFEPAVLWGGERLLREEQRLAVYDLVFCVSEWCRRNAARSYPALARRFVVTGLPIDFSQYDPYRTIPKEPDLVVFNQRFSLEKLCILEVEVARRLVSLGYRVWHLSGVPAEVVAGYGPHYRALLELARASGMEFVYNPTKEIYHERLARAAVTVTTSASDMLPSAVIEAVYLGAVPVAPRALCFPEFIHPDNLYEPYDLEEMVALVERRPRREHPIDRYACARVMDLVVSHLRGR